MRGVGAGCWVLVVGLLAPLLAVGCKTREPWGGCAFDEVEIASDFMTPWGTMLEDDLVQLMGPHEGTLAWRDGEDVVVVPRAGEDVPVEAVVDVDRGSARMRVYQGGGDMRVCESDVLLVEGVVSFMRIDDGEVELATPVTFTREEDWSRYIAEVDAIPVAEFVPGLEPLQEFPTEHVTARIEWGESVGFSAEYDYFGQRSDSPGTGAGVSQLIAEFVMSR